MFILEHLRDLHAAVVIEDGHCREAGVTVSNQRRTRISVEFVILVGARKVVVGQSLFPQNTGGNHVAQQERAFSRSLPHRGAKPRHRSGSVADTAAELEVYVGVGVERLVGPHHESLARKIPLGHGHERFREAGRSKP
jgi:hypothetical protein